MRSIPEPTDALARRCPFRPRPDMQSQPADMEALPIVLGIVSPWLGKESGGLSWTFFRLPCPDQEHKIMSAHEAFLKFLHIDPEDFEFLNQYRTVLQQGAQHFTESFYEYLLATLETAAALQGQKLSALVEVQATHFERLLTDRFTQHYQVYLQRVGRVHQQLGISPAWIAGGYSLYKEHLNSLLNSSSVLAADRARLRRIVSEIIFADLNLQLQGYASAQSEEDATRTALIRALIGTTLMVRSNATWDSLLQRMCHELVSEDTHILAAWGAILEPGSYGLSVAFSGDAAIQSKSFRIPQHPDNPCWQALVTGESVILQRPDIENQEWLADALPHGSQEVAFIPFGNSNTGYAGVGIVVADYAKYFQRIGLDHFKAFSHFCDLALNLRDQSLRDPLTGLPNRALFHDRLAHALSGASRRERLLAIGVLDMDGFKAINDQYGHTAGDELLRQAVARLQGAMRQRDTLARIGGDEFGLLLDDFENVFQLEALGNRLLDVIREPFRVEDRLVSVSASIGFTLHPLDDGDGDTLLRHADMAMYASKTCGRDMATLYSTLMSPEASRHGQMSRELHGAIESGALLLHYQPQVDMATGAVIGVEALLRWNHQSRGLLLPEDFMEVLEKGPMSHRLGRYVLDRAMRQARVWNEQGLSLRVAVNVGARYLLSPEFVQDLRALLIRYPLTENMLEIEVTEHTNIQEISSAREVLTQCRALGFAVVLDDFGTGNAPLSHLQMLPANSLKIDRGFVQNILSNPKDAAIVAGVITSARLLDMEVIAEGVESEEQGRLLLQLGCMRAQGYAIAKPMLGEEIPAWIRCYRGNPSWEYWKDHPWKPDDYSMLIAAL